jgi:hypothetical protein
MKKPPESDLFDEFFAMRSRCVFDRAVRDDLPQDRGTPMRISLMMLPFLSFMTQISDLFRRNVNLLIIVLASSTASSKQACVEVTLSRASRPPAVALSKSSKL